MATQTLNKQTGGKKVLQIPMYFKQTNKMLTINVIKEFYYTLHIIHNTLRNVTLKRNTNSYRVVSRPNLPSMLHISQWTGVISIYFVTFSYVGNGKF